MASDARPIIHRGVALMICENEAILEETMLTIDTSKLHIERIGGRAIIAPAYQLKEIRQALKERGMFPKVVGDVVDPDVLEPEEEGEEGAQDDEAADTTEQQEENA